MAKGDKHTNGRPQRDRPTKSTLKQVTIRDSFKARKPAARLTRERVIASCDRDTADETPVNERVFKLELMCKELFSVVENLERENNLTKSIIFGVHVRPKGMTNDKIIETILMLMGFNEEDARKLRERGTHHSKHMVKANAMQIKWTSEHIRHVIYSNKKELANVKENPFDPLQNRRLSITDSLTQRQVVEQGITHRIFTHIKAKAAERNDRTVFKKYSWSHIKVGDNKPRHYRQIAEDNKLDWHQFESKGKSNVADQRNSSPMPQRTSPANRPPPRTQSTAMETDSQGDATSSTKPLPLPPASYNFSARPSASNAPTPTTQHTDASPNKTPTRTKTVEI